MSNWPIYEIRKAIAELSERGLGGNELLRIISSGSKCAPVECDQLDFKRQVSTDEIGLAEACRDIAAFYNMFGGYVVVGVQEDDNENFEIVGASIGFDVERLKDKLKDLTGERILLTQEICSWDLSRGQTVQVFVLNIPSRQSSRNPISFLKDGPGKGSKGRRVFEKDEIPIRDGDQTSIARGVKVAEIWECRRHPLLLAERRQISPLTRIVNNLPDRNIICPQVMGRREALEHLWRWLPDDLSHVKVLAGEGGIGKSSVAYEFADQVSLMDHQAFQQVVWLSAKQRQFRPLTNSFDEMAETHFGSYDELLDRICESLAVTEDDGLESNRAKKLRFIKGGFEVMPSLVVVDDIDSLEVLEQRQALELGFLLSGTKTKLLLTTRNNITYSGDVCYTVRGIDKGEFPEFFQALMTRFPSPTRRIPKASEIDKIWEVSKGSPLFAESILRLLAYQTVGEAIGNWKGQAGDEVRRAALQREILQLSSEARRILLTLALLSEASVAELAEVTGYESGRVSDAVNNLSSLYLVEAPRLGSEHRIRVSETTGRLVLSMQRELAADHVRLEKAIRDFRRSAATGDGQNRGTNKLVGAAILQASALERQGKVPEALETLLYATRKTAKGKRGDLFAYVGHLHTKMQPADFDLSRRACREAFNEGCLKSRLFETWFNSEWELGNFPGTEEVARAALEKSVEPVYEWRIRLAAALSSKARAQGGGRITVSVLPAYLESSKELAEAIRHAPADEARKWRRNLEEANDLIFQASSDATVAAGDRLTLIRHLITFIKQGDFRIRNYVRAFSVVEELLATTARRSNEKSSHESAARSSFQEIDELVSQRLERFASDERNEILLAKRDSVLVKFDLPYQTSEARKELKLERAEHDDDLENLTVPDNIEPKIPPRAQESSPVRTPLPDHLSSDKRSSYYISDCFEYPIGIRLDGVERTNVQEYCISEGWVKIPSGKTRDRYGRPLLVKVKGKVEAFYKDRIA